MAKTTFFGLVREYEHERYTEYRGVIASTETYHELDVCTHKHRTEEAARACGNRMARKMAREQQAIGKPLIEIL